MRRRRKREKAKISERECFRATFKKINISVQAPTVYSCHQVVTDGHRSLALTPSDSLMLTWLPLHVDLPTVTCRTTYHYISSYLLLHVGLPTVTFRTTYRYMSDYLPLHTLSAYQNMYLLNVQRTLIGHVTCVIRTLVH